MYRDIMNKNISFDGELSSIQKQGCLPNNMSENEKSQEEISVEVFKFFKERDMMLKSTVEKAFMNQAPLSF